MIFHDVLELAQEAHAGQTRKYTGEPYLMHPLRVAALVGGYGPTCVLVALLHDVLEDCPAISAMRIQAVAGLEVRCGVEALTNPSKGTKFSRAERKKMDREHIATQPRDARIIKAYDRIDNLRDMGDAPADFRRLYAHESEQLLEVLAPVLTPEEVQLFNGAIIGMRD
jgi:(p)ppGpp synthase/HD superfamily hydrolase